MDRAALVGESAARLFAAVERMAARAEREGRPFALLILQAKDPLAVQSEYYVLASAPWLDNLIPRPAIDHVLEGLMEELGPLSSPGFDAMAGTRILPSSFAAAAAVRLPNQPGWVGRAVVRGVELEEAYVVTLRSLASMESEASPPITLPLSAAKPREREPARRRKAS